MAAGQASEDEMRLRRANGEYRWFLVRTVPLSDEQGQIVKWYGSSTDIEDRKRAEKESGALIDAIPQQIWSSPPDGATDYCNKRWRSYTGLDRDGLRGYGWQAMIHPEDRDRVLKAWHESVANGTPYEQEERHRAADGTYRWFLSLGVPLRDAEGRIVRWYGTNTDIEDRMQAEKQLEHYAHLLQVLSRRLFHIQEEERRHLARELHDEIGQTLTAAKINLKIIAPDVPAKIKNRLNDSMQLLDRLLRQVRELSLDLRPPLLDELGLVPTLRWLVDQQAKRAGLRVTFTSNVNGLELDPDVQTNCFRVAQEAITNIVRHSGAKSVAVNLRHEGERLWLSVRDDGAGFDPAVLQQRPAQHSTLGLVSMKERALLVRGGFEIHSAPGQGTEIRAWFPVALEEHAAKTA
jgi:PAS domain S-box-containing protein